MSLEKITTQELSSAWNVLEILQRTQKFNVEQSTRKVLERFEFLENSKELIMGEIVDRVHPVHNDLKQKKAS
ncbi:hypothetical protein NZD85_04940 [Empedobacter stercoris]|uniref:hypothetical protein n=1 Tax=Empedobacter TaxID=59734 RepID=UPI0021AEB01F|nr:MULTISPECIES: hypothetical protein [Empedobacter]UWX67953.1 hypothetical protein NZD85_04940 [Empedobacter stercoris]